MKRTVFSLLFLFFLPVFLSFSQEEEPQKKKVFYFSISEEISKRSWERVKEALKQAKEAKSDIIIVTINTYGGAVVYADSIRTAFLKLSIPIYAFVNNNAASAGALISMATNKIFMVPEGTIGAASVVNQEGEIMPEKYQSYMRGIMRATAQSRDRDPDIAQAMVDPDVEIEGIIEKEKVLTLTSKEAKEHGICEEVAASKKEILEHLGIEIEQEETLVFSATQKVKFFFLNPIISSLLIMLIFGGIYFEFSTPGLGIPAIIAVCAATLYFAPLYIEGLASNVEIILFIIGIILLIVEVFILPGFGVAGILGIGFILYGLSFGLLGDITPPKGTEIDFSPIIGAFTRVILSLVIGIILSLFIAERFLSTSFFGKSIALSKRISKKEGFVSQSTDLSELVGKTGKTITDLRPSGTVEVEQKRYDSISKDGFIEVGTVVEVIGAEVSHIEVAKTLNL